MKLDHEIDCISNEWVTVKCSLAHLLLLLQLGESNLEANHREVTSMKVSGSEQPIYLRVYVKVPRALFRQEIINSSHRSLMPIISRSTSVMLFINLFIICSVHLVCKAGRLFAKAATRCNVVKMLKLLTVCPRTSSGSARAIQICRIIQKPIQWAPLIAT